jgi:cAMP-dependent protein kinase regulator
MRFGFSRPKFENLDRYLADKDYEKALVAVADELKRKPRQFNLLLRQAEILGLAGNRDQAIDVYRELAEKYARDGFYAKAIALYKKVLRLDSGLEEVHAELARLIEEDQKSQLPLQERLKQAEAESRQREDDDAADLEQEIKELRASALFASFREEALEEVLTVTSLRSYQEGDIIVTEGEPGSSLFLIASGEVKVFTRGERGEHVPLAELCSGDFFGEVSLLTGRPRTATITAKSQVIAIELDKDDVDRIASEHPEVLEVLEEFYQRRAHETVEAVIRRLRGED